MCQSDDSDVMRVYTSMCIRGLHHSVFGPTKEVSIPKAYLAQEVWLGWEAIRGLSCKENYCVNIDWFWALWLVEKFKAANNCRQIWNVNNYIIIRFAIACCYNICAAFHNFSKNNIWYLFNCELILIVTKICPQTHVGCWKVHLLLSCQAVCYLQQRTENSLQMDIKMREEIGETRAVPWA